MREVGVRELRAQLREVLDAVERGEQVIVTRDGKPVARMDPVPLIPPDAPPGAVELIKAGKMTWSGRPLRDFEPMPLIGEGPTVSEILLEQRGPRVRRE